MTNSSWTADHVAQLFWSWQLPAVVHPPCDTAELSRLPLQRKLKRLYLVSLAQVPVAAAVAAAAAGGMNAAAAPAFRTY